MKSDHILSLLINCGSDFNGMRIEVVNEKNERAKALELALSVFMEYEAPVYSEQENKLLKIL